MAYDIIGNCKSIISTNDMGTTRQQYVFVSIDTNGQIVAATHTGSYAVGVLQDTPPASSPGLVCNPGDITKVLCGGTITPGQFVMTNASGQAVAATSSSHILGVCLTAGANNFIATIIFQPMGTI